MRRKPIVAAVVAFIALAASHATVTSTAAGAAPAAPTVAATIAVGLQPWGVAFSPDGGTAYVGNSGTNTVSVIDVATRMATTVTDPYWVFSGPAGVAVAPNGSIFVTGFVHWSVTRMSASDPQISWVNVDCVNPLAITMRDDGAVAYIGCFGGKIQSVATDTLMVSNVVQGLNQVRDVAYVPKGTKARDDIAYINNVTSGATGGHFRLHYGGMTAPLPGYGMSVAVDRDGTRAYVGGATGILSVFDIVNKTLLHEITVGGDLQGIALSQDGRLAYVTDNAGNSLKVVDLDARTVTHTVTVGRGPLRVALSPDERTLLVTNNNASSVSLISIPAPPVAPVPAPPVAPVSGSSLRVACGAEATSIGATVVCAVSGGDPGIDIMWRAAYNPVIAEAGVTLDASGAGEFSFVVPAAALGEVVTVELMDWLAPVSLGVVGGPVPGSVPAGEGPDSLRMLVLLALAGGLVAVRRSRGASDALRRR